MPIPSPGATRVPSNRNFTFISGILAEGREGRSRGRRAGREQRKEWHWELQGGDSDTELGTPGDAPLQQLPHLPLPGTDGGHWDGSGSSQLDPALSLLSPALSLSQLSPALSLFLLDPTLIPCPNLSPHTVPLLPPHFPTQLAPHGSPAPLGSTPGHSILQEQRESRDPSPQPEQQDEALPPPGLVGTAPGKELEPPLPFQRCPLIPHFQTGSRDRALPSTFILQERFKHSWDKLSHSHPVPPTWILLFPVGTSLPGAPGRAELCPPPSRDRLCPGHVFPEDFFGGEIGTEGCTGQKGIQGIWLLTGAGQARRKGGKLLVPVLVPGSARGGCGRRDVYPRVLPKALWPLQHQELLPNLLLTQFQDPLGC